MFFIVSRLFAQGPTIPYYYHPSTELSFASCLVFQEGGSRQRIPFLPVVSRHHWRGPLGTMNYTQDIHIRSPLVFIGNGIVSENVHNCYEGRRWDYTTGEIDVEEKTVIFCFDAPDSMSGGGRVPIERRILDADSRGASGIVLFTSAEGYPFLYAGFQTAMEIPDIPVITITRQSFIDILNSAGEDGRAMIETWQKDASPPMSRELISNLELNIKGKFDRLETKHFNFRYREKRIPGDDMRDLIEVNERALKFIFHFFEGSGRQKWDRKMNVYFRDFDSKIFYTHHWGSGLASAEGVFMVHRGGDPKFALAVHENTHIYTDTNWSEHTSSFMSEGIAKYVEAAATDPDQNHLLVLEFLNQNELHPLEELLPHQIGLPGPKTRVGYPAAGSFSGFLLEQYGMEPFKQAYILEGRTDEEKQKEDTWQKCFGMPIETLEREWLSWLADRYRIDRSVVDKQLVHILERRDIRKQREAEKPCPDTWPVYTGLYVWEEMGRSFEIRIIEETLMMVTADMPDLKIRLIPAEKNGFRMEGGAMDGAVLTFHLDNDEKPVWASIGEIKFIRK